MGPSAPRDGNTDRSVMSIDLEDWFQVENLKSAIPRDTWDHQEYRLEANTEELLKIFAETETKATFFCLGWVADRSPTVIRRIHDAGHEIAGHGYAHRLVYDQSPAAFREDIVRAKGVLEDLSGTAVLGYRAPSFSITPWALAILAETGYAYDSSVFPVTGHDRYAALELREEDRVDRQDEPFGPNDSWVPQGPLRPVYRIPTDTSSILEVPIATFRLGGHLLPWGGGGYFRLIPYPLFAAGFRRGMRDGTAPIFYLHPWEIDPGQPRVRGIKKSYAFRHYTNLGRTAGRLRHLCESVSFGRADDALRLRE